MSLTFVIIVGSLAMFGISRVFIRIFLKNEAKYEELRNPLTCAQYVRMMAYYANYKKVRKCHKNYCIKTENPAVHVLLRETKTEGLPESVWILMLIQKIGGYLKKTKHVNISELGLISVFYIQKIPDGPVKTELENLQLSTDLKYNEQHFTTVGYSIYTNSYFEIILEKNDFNGLNDYEIKLKVIDKHSKEAPHYQREFKKILKQFNIQQVANPPSKGERFEEFIGQKNKKKKDHAVA